MPTFRGHDFDRVQNAVTDLGMDNTGGSSVTSDLHNISGGTLAVFPDGEYLFGDVTAAFGSTGGQSIGIVAKAAWDAYQAGDITDPFESDTVDYDDLYTSNVNFRPDPKGGKIRAVRIGKSATTNVLVEGITLDHSNTSEANDDSGTLGITLGIGDSEDIDIRNIDHKGRAINYATPGSEEIAISAGTESPTGTAVVHGCNLEKMHDQTLYGTSQDNPDGRIGYYTGLSHIGSVEFNDCSVSEVGNNGWYCSAPVRDDPNVVDASVTIDGCYAENCGASGFRVSGGNSKIINCEAVYDDSIYTGPYFRPELGGSRPIVLESSTPGTVYEGSIGDTYPQGKTFGQQEPGVTVENTKVTMRPCHKSSIAINAYQTEREVNIINCEIDIDGVDPGVISPIEGDVEHGWIMRGPYTNGHGGNDPGEDPRGLNIEDTTIIVQNVPSTSVTECMVAASDANGTTINNGTCIQAINNETAHDGVTVELYNTANYNSFDATLQNININVAGNAINNIGGNTILQQDVSTSETCSFGDDPAGGAGETFFDDFSDYL